MKLIETYKTVTTRNQAKYHLRVLFKKIEITGKEYSMVNNILGKLRR